VLQAAEGVKGKVGEKEPEAGVRLLLRGLNLSARGGPGAGG